LNPETLTLRPPPQPPPAVGGDPPPDPSGARTSYDGNATTFLSGCMQRDGETKEEEAHCVVRGAA
jgi:hypothetical protein